MHLHGPGRAKDSPCFREAQLGGGFNGTDRRLHTSAAQSADAITGSTLLTPSPSSVLLDRTSKMGGGGIGKAMIFSLSSHLSLHQKQSP